MFKKEKCKICGKQFEFEIHSSGKFKKMAKPHNIKTCSPECHYKNVIRISKEQRERKKKVIVVKKCRFCGKEVMSNKYCPRSFCGGRAGECYKKFLSKSRKGEGNPAYKGGFATTRNIYTGKHLYACKKYKNNFLIKNNYLYCEICGVNSNGTQKFEVHHIYYASLFPKHKELHNPKNLILLCINCHNKMHSGNMRNDVFKEIEKKRGLKKLFGVKSYAEDKYKAN